MGSLLVILTTAVIGVFLGVSAGIYLEEYARRNWITNIIEINISNLAGVPSIVYGLLALGTVCLCARHRAKYFHGGLDACASDTADHRRRNARGDPRRSGEPARGCLWHRLHEMAGDQRPRLPAALPGVLTGVIIGVSRALGETAPLITIGALTFIAFLPSPPVTSEFPFISFSWLFDGFTVLPIQAFNWISRPGSDFHANAAAAGIVLLVITLGLNSLAIYARYRLRKKLQW